ncbi:MAG TPA: hypothetical protein VK444_08820 [Methanobacteriaceae archaeon]|nr:hypothetical protein [Methanobacteriaceae archaeon]
MKPFLPTKFQLEHVFFGQGGVNQLTLEDEKLIFRWESSINRDETLREVEIEPLDQEWLQFWSVLDEIGVWDWEEQYQPPTDILADGDIFSIEINYSGQNIKTDCWCNAPPRIEEFYHALEDLTDLNFQFPGGVKD